MRPEEAEQLRELAQKLLGLSRSEGESFLFSEDQVYDSQESLLVEHNARFNDKQLLDAARSEIDRRKMRKAFLPADWFAEGSWNILLDLYEGEQIDRKTSITSACIAADVPTTTGIRNIGQLMEAGLVQKIPDPKDNRRTFLRLSRKGYFTMRDLLSSMIDTETSIARRAMAAGGGEP